TFVLEKEPKNLDGLALLAAMAGTPEEVDGAIRRFETVQDDLGDRAKLHLALGVLYLRKQDAARAERAFQEAVAREPKSAEAHLVLGRVHLAKQENTEAIQEFQQVLKLDPGNAMARYQLGIAQIQVGNLQQAKAELKEAISAAPNLTEAVLLLAELNIQEGA